MHQYAGNDVTPITQIKGTGFIDENYRQTVKDLAHQAETTYDGIHSRSIHVADHAKPQLLQNRKPLSITPPLMLSEKYKTAKAKFTIALNNIAKKAEELDEKGDNIFKFFTNEKQSDLYYSYKAAATAARQLYDAVVNESKFYPIDKDQLAFKKAIDDAIKVAINSELGNHRGYLKEIIGYAGLAVLAVLTVATAGIAYAIAGGINYAVHRQFFFSTKLTTDSIDKVLDLKEAVNVLITSHP
ncbi:hypothetical protein [Legionella fairfieldensis]|uniref:hypothetical protein n=1 Tax=Legionella fairfieldensis TaxID=45064 RepID=UPI0010412D41|nr:hypothetical protein [Legionella fairfieldensis]